MSSIFPVVTSAAQEPAKDDFDADAAMVYSSAAPVVINSGESRLDRVDLRVPGRGQIYFEFSRRYRSRLDYDGPLGFGWDFSYNERLLVLGNGDVVRSNGDGHVDVWTSLGGGLFTAPLGFFGTLTKEVDGTYILRETDGFRRTFDVAGRLMLHEDRFGNSMQFGYDQTDHLSLVTDAYGRTYEFSYQNFSGHLRLTIVRDFSGREVHYGYDSRGDLVSARSPVVTGTSTSNDFPAGRTEQYTYSSGTGNAELDHNLLTVTYPQEVEMGGPQAITYVYGDTGIDHDRVLTMTLGGTNASGVAAGGTVLFGYQEMNQGQPPGDSDLPRLEVSVTERNGNEFVCYVNEFEHMVIIWELTQGLRPGEPSDHYETNFYYDADGQKVAEFLPEGNTNSFTYDLGSRAAQRNLIRISRIADVDRGGGEDLVTTMFFEPVFNQLAAMTDPRGNAIGFSPPIGSASAERYTTLHFFDYQEGGAPIPDVIKYGIDLTGIDRNLGDLNGDGVTDQIAGNPVRTEYPTVLLRPGSNEAARLGSTSQFILTEMQWNSRGQEIAEIDPEGNLTTYDYYPENDPDSDGTPVPGQSSTLPRGYLRATTVDATPPPPRRTSASLPAVLETVLEYDSVGNTTSVRDPSGVVTAFEINQLNEVVVTTRGADVSHAVSTGQLITGEVAFGYRERYHYDFNGRVVLFETEDRGDVSTTAGVGDWVERTATYDLLDNLVESTVEVNGGTTLITERRYEENELLAQLAQPEGNVQSFDYDERDLLFKVHSGFGAPEVATIQYDYDLNGSLQRRIDAEDTDGSDGPEVTLYTHDGFDRRTMVTDALDGQEVSSYDVASNIIQVQFLGHPPNSPGSSNVLLADRFFSHDELDRRYQIDEDLFLADGFSPLRPEDLRDHNSDGFVTTFDEFDALSRPTFKVEDDTDVTTFSYDGASRRVEVMDALGNRVVATHDKNSNVVQLVSHELSPEALVPDESFTTLHVYDQLDRLVRSTDNAGRTSRYGYDSRDNPTTTSDEVGPPLSPDPLGLFPGAINDPGNTITRYYDGRDLYVMDISDLRVGGAGNGALDTSNPFNPDGQVTLEYVYDGNARLTALVDDNGNSTTYAYDALDRRVLQTNADTTTVVYGYDRDSNTVTVVDPNTSEITNTYDALNRLTLRSISRAAGVVGTTAESYGYDGLSRLTFSSDNNGSGPATHVVDRIYDSLNRLLEEQEDFEPHSSIWSGDGNREQLVYPTSRILDYQYDPANRVKQIVDPFASAKAGALKLTTVIAGYSWIGPGPCNCHCPCDSRPLLMAMGNGTEMSFLDPTGTAAVGYNNVKEVVGLSHLLGPAAFIDRDYTYNRASMRTGESLLDVLGSPSDAFIFDSAYRVANTFIGADGSSEGFSTEMDYTLDGVGNRETVDFTQTFNAGGNAMFTDNYLGNIVNEYDAAGGGGRSHDNNGNLTQAAGFDYVYDYRNRLVEVRRSTDKVIRARYEYDTFSRRVAKTVFDLGNPGTVVEERHYLYDEWNVIEEWGDDDDYSNNGPVATYVYGPGVDLPVQMETSVSAPAGAGQFYYHRDARQNVVAMTDTLGAVVEKTRYDDFGNFTQDPSIEQPYLFQGRRYDPETGFFYYRNRYYDPLTGRFLQRDPVWDPNNVGNQYTFVGNNPVNGTDALGLWTIQIGLEFGGGFIGGVSLSGGVVIQFGGGELIDVGLAGTFGTGLITGGEFGLTGQVVVSDSAGSTIEDLEGTSTAVGGTVAIAGGASVEQSTPTSGNGPTTTSVGLVGGVAVEGHTYQTETVTSPTLGDLAGWLGDRLYDLYYGPPPVIPPAQAAAQARRLQTDAKIRAMKKAAAAAASKKAFSRRGCSLLNATSNASQNASKAEKKAKDEARAARARERAEREDKAHRQGGVTPAPGSSPRPRNTGVTVVGGR